MSVQPGAGLEVKSATRNASAVRWQVVSLLAIVAALTYVDRLNLGIAGPHILQEYKFDNQRMGFILGAFSLGYAVFHVPGGWLADRFGAQRILAIAVLWFSAFTAATAVAPRLPVLRTWGALWSFAIVRFTMGAGEAAAIPVGNKLMGYWLGDKERGLGTSVFLAGVGLGGVGAPFIINRMIAFWNWRAAFILLGFFGMLVAGLCYLLITDWPEDNPAVNNAELAKIRGDVQNSRDISVNQRVPWKAILSSPSVWGLMLSHFCLVYPVYIFFTWFYIYLVRVRGITISKASFWTSAPFIANLVLVPTWGWLADRTADKLGKQWGRRVAAWAGILCSGVLLWSGSHTNNNTFALLQLAVSAGFNFAASAVLWTTCNDLSPGSSGSISGTMTTLGSLGGWASPIVTAFIATHFGWTYALDFAGLITLMSGFAWLLVNADQQIAWN
jgi:ACS family glucarate transporter-like MFS transporter